MKDLKKIIKTIPHSPGCYKYYNSKGELIYIGKAKDLKKRVSSYFIGDPFFAKATKDKDPKTTVLVQNIADIKWETTDSEIEALILESNLIKKYKPRYNIKIKDDKDFLWVKIDLSQEFPYPELVRRANVGTGLKPVPKMVKIFGPFTDSKLLKEGLSVLRKIFLWRDCSESKFGYYQKRKKPCLEYYIKNCSAPCQISNNNSQLGTITNKELLSNNNDYQKNIKNLIAFFEGKKERIVMGMKKEMDKYAKKKRFEEAGMVRDKIRALEHIGAALNSKFQMTNDKQISNNKFQNSNEQILINIIKILNESLGHKLKYKKDFRIEFYDISNTSGSEAVGSMVVWQGEDIARDQYRKFKIKWVKGVNDFAMMREVIYRRISKIPIFNNQIPNKSQIQNYKFQNKLPDLIFLDGGKPQLREVAKLFGELKVNIPLLSLAKENEEIIGISQKSKVIPRGYSGQANQNYGVASPQFIKLNIAHNSAEGFFIQRLRDEAHRFAIGYHKKLREKKITSSRLDDIEGIGPKTKKKLLLHFGSTQAIIKSDISELEKIIDKKLAIKIKEKL